MAVMNVTFFSDNGSCGVAEALVLGLGVADAEPANLRQLVLGLQAHLDHVHRLREGTHADKKKKEHLFERIVDTAVEKSNGDIDMEPCLHCGKGELYVIDLKYVKYQVCSLCDRKDKL